MSTKKAPSQDDDKRSCEEYNLVVTASTDIEIHFEALQLKYHPQFRDYRTDWNLIVNQPVAGTITLYVYITIESNILYMFFSKTFIMLRYHFSRRNWYQENFNFGYGKAFCDHVWKENDLS